MSSEFTLKSMAVKEAIDLLLESGFNVKSSSFPLLNKSSDPLKVAQMIITKNETFEGKTLIVNSETVRKTMIELGQLATEGPEDWDFAGANTRILTHGLHPYPARMIPQIAHRLICRYSEPRDIVYDPFCGSGTVLTECILMKAHDENESLKAPHPPRSAIGNDINPLAVLLTKTKTTPIDPYELEEVILGREFLEDSLVQRIENDIFQFRNGGLEPKKPRFSKETNINYWFKDYVIDELAIIQQHIENIKKRSIADFLKSCFSLTLRKVSNIYNPGDTFTKRLSKEKLEKYKPDVLSTFKDYTENLIGIMKDFVREPNVKRILERSSDIFTQVFFADTRKIPLSDESIDLIVTSPPYGEEKNTISYTRWTKLSSIWIGYNLDFIRLMSKASLGAQLDQINLTTPSDTLNNILNKVSQKNEKLAKSATKFFLDYYDCLQHLLQVLKHDGFCCIVIGDRSLLRRRIPMDLVTREFGSKVGFKHEKTYYRTIPTKAIPWVVGKGETISKENIVILKKG